MLCAARAAATTLCASSLANCRIMNSNWGGTVRQQPSPEGAARNGPDASPLQGRTKDVKDKREDDEEDEAVANCAACAACSATASAM